jgi:hypothetical protein
MKGEVRTRSVVVRTVEITRLTTRRLVVEIRHGRQLRRQVGDGLGLQVNGVGLKCHRAKQRLGASEQVNWRGSS